MKKHILMEWEKSNCLIFYENAHMEEMMNYYLAPLEGITGYIFRNAYSKYFGEIEKYFTPFISPNRKKICRSREKADILPEHNKGMYTVPQILTNDAAMFLETVHFLMDYGYHEVNLNLGCPVGTVVSKKKGAGFLSEPDQLKSFLDEIFSSKTINAGDDVKISIKTRIGMISGEEFEILLNVFNQFPLHELIIHPRTREDYYKNKPDLTAFSYGYENSRADVCYNGDIFSEESYDRLLEQFPKLNLVMLGRGILRNPGLVCQIRNGTVMDKQSLWKFHNMIYEGYQDILSGDLPVLFKMKELWSYMIHSFNYEPKIEKKIRKSQKLSEYEFVIQALFSKYDLKQNFA